MTSRRSSRHVIDTGNPDETRFVSRYDPDLTGEELDARLAVTNRYLDGRVEKGIEDLYVRHRWIGPVCFAYSKETGEPPYWKLPHLAAGGLGDHQFVYVGAGWHLTRRSIVLAWGPRHPERSRA